MNKTEKYSIPDSNWLFRMPLKEVLIDHMIQEIGKEKRRKEEIRPFSLQRRLKCHLQSKMSRDRQICQQKMENETFKGTTKSSKRVMKQNISTTQVPHVRGQSRYICFFLDASKTCCNR